MKSRVVTAILSILFGSTGAQRFYLGQNSLGWTYLITFYLIIPSGIWAVKYFNVMYYWESLRFGWIILLVLIHLIECIYFSTMSAEKFLRQNVSKGGAWLLTTLAIVIAIVFQYGTNYLFDLKNEIDIDKSKPEITISSLQYSQELLNNEQAFIDAYATKILQVDGKVVTTGHDMETNTNYILLEAVPNTSTDVNCYFDPDHQDDIDGIKAGDVVSVVGICDGRFLRNCRIEKIDPSMSFAVPPAVHDSL
ncbi:MAG: NINE protein [Chitinophagales bacterium]|nr:NINE protein [Chitinophagales bacterium]